MPQLDQVTFLSQFFWCSFFFIGFYFLLAKNFLPKMSRILKLRTKKINPDTDLIKAQGAPDTRSSLHYPEEKLPGQESQKITVIGDSLLANGLKTSRDLFYEGAQYADNWSKITKQGLNRQHYQDPNVMYVHSIGATSLSESFPPYAPSDAIVGLPMQTNNQAVTANVENNSGSEGPEQKQAALFLKRFANALATYILKNKSSPDSQLVPASKKQAKLAPSKKNLLAQKTAKQVDLAKPTPADLPRPSKLNKKSSVSNEVKGQSDLEPNLATQVTPARKKPGPKPKSQQAKKVTPPAETPLEATPAKATSQPKTKKGGKKNSKK